MKRSPFVLAAAGLFSLGVRTTPAQAKVTDVPYVGVVPAGIPDPASCAEGMVSLRMDDEDHQNLNDFYIKNSGNDHNLAAGGISHIDSPRRAGGNSLIQYCPTYMPSLPRLAYDYAVISASNKCPANSYRFSRRMDKEDDSNHNRTEGDATPNVSTSSSGGYTLIYFCFVPTGPTNAPYWAPQLDGSIIFGENHDAPFWGSFFMDDEDDSNNNKNWYENQYYVSSIQKIITPGGNSAFKVMSWSPVTTEDYGDALSCGQPGVHSSIECTYRTPAGPECQPTNSSYTSLLGLLSWYVCAW